MSEYVLYIFKDAAQMCLQNTALFPVLVLNKKSGNTHLQLDS